MDDKSLYLIGQLLGCHRDEVIRKYKAQGLGKSQCPRQRRKETWESTVRAETGGSAQGAAHQMQRSPRAPLGDESCWG